MDKPRILCFLDNPLGRDTEMLLPVAYAIEKYLDSEVRIKFLWDMFYIYMWRPDVILLPNIRGHHMHVEIAEFAKKNGIVVLALESEGNFITDDFYKYWGYNKKEIVYQEWLTCWSNRTMTYLKKVLSPMDQDKLILTGGTGFDRYAFEKFANQQAFLKKRNLSQYKKVVGYGGWVFGKLYGSHLDISFRHFKEWKSRENALAWVEDQRKVVKDILEAVIKNNPDILFILKKHPKEDFESDPFEGLNEMNELINYENVLYIKKEENTSDLISVADIWMGFETTTALEAWFLNKPTILINKEPDFPRSSPYKGSLIVDSSIKLQEAINEFYKIGSISGFNVLSEERKKAISQSIGFADGFNHLRAVSYFRKSIPPTHRRKSVQINLRHLRLYVLMHLGRFFYNKKLFMKLPKFNKTIYVFENRAMPGLLERKEELYKLIENFHKGNDIQSAVKKNDWGDYMAN